jgi:alpha-amylase/alpha-mannosidase (GH57 family)
MITPIRNILAKYYEQMGIPITITENAALTERLNSFTYDITSNGRHLHTFELGEMVDAFRHDRLSEAAVAAEIINCLIDTIENALSR